MLGCIRSCTGLRVGHAWSSSTRLTQVRTGCASVIGVLKMIRNEEFVIHDMLYPNVQVQLKVIYPDLTFVSSKYKFDSSYLWRNSRTHLSLPDNTVWCTWGQIYLFFSSFQSILPTIYQMTIPKLFSCFLTDSFDMGLVYKYSYVKTQDRHNI